MSKNTQLTKKQFDVIDDLLASELKESEILQKHKLRRTSYNKWLADENFVNEFDNRIAIAFKRNAARIADNASKAVNKLINMASKEGDMARKACLDIISLQKQVLANQPQARPEAKQPENPNACLSDEAAGRILAALAQEK